jgi:acetoin utilization deacetylase AcuC-like enzyme
MALNHVCCQTKNAVGNGQTIKGFSLFRPPGHHATPAVYRAVDCLLQFSSDIILVSAGFDAFVRDPLTEMTLEQEHFVKFGRRLKETGIAFAAILEGGHSDDLTILVEAFLAEWGD